MPSDSAGLLGFTYTRAPAQRHREGAGARRRRSPDHPKKLNLHYTLSLDLFGSEVSTNAANAYNAGLKGRFRETAIDDDHRLENDFYPVLKFVNGEIKLVDEPALTALNMRLRDDYTRDCAKGIERFNKIIERIGIDFRWRCRMSLSIATSASSRTCSATPSGVLIDAATWAKQKDQWLPSLVDGEFIASLMKPVSEPGQFASWIAPPRVGIDNRPGDFEYVKLEAA